MVLNLQQFKDHLGQKVSAVVDKQSNRFLDYMDRQGADLGHAVAEQTAHLEHYGMPKE
jgi:hypothetical protein